MFSSTGESFASAEKIRFIEEIGGFGLHLTIIQSIFNCLPPIYGAILALGL
jgi:hypothetical protein